MRRVLERVGWVAAGLALVALALRLTVRDRVPVAATLFYATPLPVVAVLLIAAAACWRRRRGAAALAIGALVAAMAVAPAILTRPAAAGRADGKAVRLLLWNVGHRGDATYTRQCVARFAPDVVVLVETGRVSRGAIRAWDWPATVATDGMLVLAKESVHDEGPLDLGDAGLARSFVVRSKGASIRLVVADVSSNPFVRRKAPLAALARHATETAGPLVVLGDFNTPAESVWFDPLRREFANAFELAGRGWAPTWPVPLPVLQVDHVWLRGLTPARTRHGWVRGFDHRPVIVDLSPP